MTQFEAFLASKLGQIRCKTTRSGRIWIGGETGFWPTPGALKGAWRAQKVTYGHLLARPKAGTTCSFWVGFWPDLVPGKPRAVKAKFWGKFGFHGSSFSRDQDLAGPGQKLHVVTWFGRELAGFWPTARSLREARRAQAKSLRGFCLARSKARTTCSFGRVFGPKLAHFWGPGRGPQKWRFLCQNGRKSANFDGQMAHLKNGHFGQVGIWSGPYGHFWSDLAKMTKMIIFDHFGQNG